MNPQFLYGLALGIFIGALLGAVVIACCCAAGNADRVSQEWLDRQEGKP